jgi:hypothetical protein
MLIDINLTFTPPKRCAKDHVPLSVVTTTPVLTIWSAWTS